MVQKPRIFAGIDFSLSSPAICVYRSSRKLEFKNTSTYFIFQTKTQEKLKLPSNLNGISFDKKLYEDNIERFDALTDRMMDVLDLYNVNHIFLENYSFASKGMVFNIAECCGMFKYKCWQRDIPITLLSPSQPKSLISKKGVKCDKAYMGEVFHAETGLNLKELMKQGNKVWNPSSDIVDAWYILKYGVINNNGGT